MRRPAIAACLLAALATTRPVHATWSILLVDVTTGAVAVGSATCLTRFDLRRATPVVLVGRGVAVAQARVEPTGALRRLIRDELAKGTAPASILAKLAARDPIHRYRQYGIADTLGRVAAFSGGSIGRFAGHRTGRVGDLVYAVQGNLLTGRSVLDAAEQAVRTTPGDLAAKLMAAMEAAARQGGDGRCSCSVGNPTACGSPPRSFRKSAHAAFMIVARQGDRDGGCDAGGCANGGYFFLAEVADARATDPDPVLTLRRAYDAWRAGRDGRPDHLRSEVLLSNATLPADGRTGGFALVVLRDHRGRRVVSNRYTVRATRAAGSSAAVRLGSVLSLGEGLFGFRIEAAPRAGKARLDVRVEGGGRSVLLSPRPRVRCTDDALWASAAAIPVETGGWIALVARGGAARRGRSYVVVAGVSGDRPGLRLPGGAVVPVRPDAVTGAFLEATTAGLLPGFAGRLDGTGRATATFVVPPGWTFLAGRELTLAFALLDPSDFASNAVGVRFDATR